MNLQDPVLCSSFGCYCCHPGCPHWWASWVIRRDILWSCGSKAGCFVSKNTIALSIRPPTRIIPSSFMKGLSILKSSFLRQLCRLSCATLICEQSLTSFSSCFPLASNLFFTLSTHAITCNNFFQFEYATTLMTRRDYHCAYFFCSPTLSYIFF